MMKKILQSLTVFLILGLAGNAVALNAPALTVNISGVNVSLSWNTVPGATGYLLLYAPYPYTGEASIDGLELAGNTTTFSVDLWSGAAFYVAVMAGNATELTNYSNIELIQINSAGGGSGGTSNASLSGCYSPDNSGWLSYYCFNGAGGWYNEDWNVISGCTGTLESGTYQLQGSTLSMCDSTGCDYYSIQIYNGGLSLDGEPYSSTNGCN